MPSDDHKIINNNDKYWVSQKKLLHKSEEKMYKKMKMTSQGAENLVHVQQHQGKHFYKNIFFFFLSIQLIWLFEYLILTILILTKHLQNLFKDSSLSVIFIRKKSLFQVVWIMLKMSKDNFFWDTQYNKLMIHFPMSLGVSKWASEWVNELVSERCKQRSEQSSEWPSTYVWILGCSGP